MAANFPSIRKKSVTSKFFDMTPLSNVFNVCVFLLSNFVMGNSMSNDPIFLDVDTLASQILFIFSLFVDNIEMINPRKFQPLVPYCSKVIEI